MVWFDEHRWFDEYKNEGPRLAGPAHSAKSHYRYDNGLGMYACHPSSRIQVTMDFAVK